MQVDKIKETEQFIFGLEKATAQEKAEVYLKYSVDGKLFNDELIRHPNRSLVFEYYKYIKPVQNLSCVSCFHSLRKHVSNNYVNTSPKISCYDLHSEGRGPCGCSDFVADNLTYIEKEAAKKHERENSK